LSAATDSIFWVWDGGEKKGGKNGATRPRREKGGGGI